MIRACAVMWVVSMGFEGNVRVISFAPSAADCFYTLQCQESLTEGVWSDVPGQGPRPGIGRRDVMIHTNAAPAGFYRIFGAPVP